MSKYREYVIAQPERFVKLPDGTFVPVMRPLIADADAVLRSQVTIGCVDGREGHPNAKLVGSCKVECPDCGARWEQSHPIDFEQVRG